MPERSAKDWESLSAYVDGALTPRERARLEARLAQEPALRRELEQLRALRAALRDLPPPRLPRNFTLRPERPTPARARPWPGSWWRGATALVAVLLLAVVLADWGLGRAMKPAAAPPVERPLAAAPATASVEAQALEEPQEGATAPKGASGAAASEEKPLAPLGMAPQATLGGTPTPAQTPTTPVGRVGHTAPTRPARSAVWRVVEGVLVLALALLLALRLKGRGGNRSQS